MKLFCLLFLLQNVFSSVHAQSSQKILNVFLDDSVVRTGFAGVALYDPAAKKYIIDYNAEKNFLPSSNVKLFTLYAGMKYLGDSIRGLTWMQRADTILAWPTGDPTFLHPDFKTQPVFNFLNRSDKTFFLDLNSGVNKYGNGWVWDDYTEDFMPERSAFPIYGNLIRFSCVENQLKSVPDINKLYWFNRTVQEYEFPSVLNKVARSFYSNTFFSSAPIERCFFTEKISVPFITSPSIARQFLEDTVHHKIFNFDDVRFADSDTIEHILYSRPTDSLFRPMMFNSDNFFAEQTLLMVSNKQMHKMNDKEIIDLLLTSDLKDIPTKPRWVDGSGLSRYNLFSPKDFVYILEKTEKEFGWKRLKNILPTAGQGTLKGYYENLSGLIYAKTGSMSNNVSLSGFIYGKSGNKLIFSVIINNFSGSGRSGRKAIETLLLRLREIN